MKKSGLMIAGLLFISASLQAQERKHRSPEERATGISEHLSEQLSLTEEQKAKVYTLQLKKVKERDKMQAERRKQAVVMRERQKAYQEELNHILTPEQQTKWDNIRAERLKNTRQRFRHKPGMYKKPVKEAEVQASKPTN